MRGRSFPGPLEAQARRLTQHGFPWFPMNVRDRAEMALPGVFFGPQLVAANDAQAPAPLATMVATPATEADRKVYLQIVDRYFKDVGERDV